MKLQIGCGNNKLDGYVTIDRDHDVSPDVYADAHDLYMIENNSVDIIYASHILEYYDWSEAEEIVLPEWRRVLKNDGILRVAVPDFKQISELYGAGFDLSFFIGPLYGKWKNKDKIIYHKTVYDYKKLLKILAICGFYNIKRWKWQDIHPHDFDDYSKSYIPHMEFERGILISLNVECNKQGE